MSVKFELHDSIALITINRPEAKNALNDQVRESLYEALSRAAGDAAVRGVMITGGKEVFSAGADIQALAGATAVQVLYRRGLQRLVRLIEEMAKPVMAVIGGYALGGGCELALACDIRIAAENAVFGQPEIRLGIIPGGGGTQRLARLVGMGRAKDLIFSGRLIDAAEALRIGLVEAVVPLEELFSAAEEKMRSYIRHGAVAIGAAKLAINTGMNVDRQSGDVLENLCFSLLFATADQKEGMHAFLEKRKPVFKGE